MSKSKRKKTVTGYSKKNNILRELYDQTYARMDDNLRASAPDFKHFKARVLSTIRNDYYKGEKIDPSQHELFASVTQRELKAITKKRLNRETYTSPAERSRVNMMQGLKEKHRDVYNVIRKLSRDERGQFKKVEDNMTWNKDHGGYVIGGRYFVDVQNSPESVSIIDLITNTTLPIVMEA